MKRSAKILAPFNAKAAATYSSTSLAEVRRPHRTAFEIQSQSRLIPL
jgi:hypothetical protein